MRQKYDDKSEERKHKAFFGMFDFFFISGCEYQIKYICHDAGESKGADELQHREDNKADEGLSCKDTAFDDDFSGVGIRNAIGMDGRLERLVSI